MAEAREIGIDAAMLCYLPRPEFGIHWRHPRPEREARAVGSLTSLDLLVPGEYGLGRRFHTRPEPVSPCDTDATVLGLALSRVRPITGGLGVWENGRTGG
jgi:hypothetical protein